jgi:hypothetical protein
MDDVNGGPQIVDPKKLSRSKLFQRYKDRLGHLGHYSRGDWRGSGQSKKTFSAGTVAQA